MDPWTKRLAWPRQGAGAVAVAVDASVAGLGWSCGESFSNGCRWLEVGGLPDIFSEVLWLELRLPPFWEADPLMLYCVADI